MPSTVESITLVLLLMVTLTPDPYTLVVITNSKINPQFIFERSEVTEIVSEVNSVFIVRMNKHSVWVDDLGISFYISICNGTELL